MYTLDDYSTGAYEHMSTEVGTEFKSKHFPVLTNAYYLWAGLGGSANLFEPSMTLKYKALFAEFVQFKAE